MFSWQDSSWAGEPPNGRFEINQLIPRVGVPNAGVAARTPTYREVAECIDLRRPLLQLPVVMGHGVLQERLQGGLMELLLLLLLCEQVWIELTRRLHHLLLHIEGTTLLTHREKREGGRSSARSLCNPEHPHTAFVAACLGLQEQESHTWEVAEYE